MSTSKKLAGSIRKSPSKRHPPKIIHVSVKEVSPAEETTEEASLCSDEVQSSDVATKTAPALAKTYSHQLVGGIRGFFDYIWQLGSAGISPTSD